MHITFLGNRNLSNETGANACSISCHIEGNPENAVFVRTKAQRGTLMDYALFKTLLRGVYTSCNAGNFILKGKKLRTLTQRGNYIEQPSPVGEVSDDICG
jgi:hypothetical protein